MRSLHPPAVAAARRSRRGPLRDPISDEFAMSTDFRERARRLRNAVEPVAAGVYFAPEAHAVYEALGFDRSSLASPDGIARPELKSYFTSRGACMGHVPGEIVAAAFGVCNRKVVARSAAPRRSRSCC
jgi:hypothetical protein